MTATEDQPPRASSGAREEPEPPEPVETEERRQLRPYRRLVGVLFTVAVSVAAVIILRGIIRHLDRMPTAGVPDKSTVVDVRALRACAEDLEKLEARVRQGASAAFGVLPAEDRAPADWESIAHPFEVDRLSIVARCHLEEPTTDTIVTDLEAASNEIEALIRSYALLYGRHSEDGLPHALEARRILKRAGAALSAR